MSSDDPSSRIQELTEDEAKRFRAEDALTVGTPLDGARVKLPETKEEIDAFLESMPLLATEDNPEFQSSDEFLALQTMIEESTPEERVQAFKDGGNKALSLGAQYLALSRSPKERKERLQEFKEEGMMRLEDGIQYYAQALGIKGCENKVLLSIVYSNRAMGHLHLRQYGHCKGDVAQAIRLNPYNLKAYFRGAKAFQALRQYPDGLKLLDFGLKAAERWSKVLSTEEKLEIRKLGLSLERRELEKDVGLHQNNWFTDEEGKPANLKTIWSEYEKQVEQQTLQLQNLQTSMSEEWEKLRAKEADREQEKQKLRKAEERRKSLWEAAIQHRKIRIGQAAFMDHSAKRGGKRSIAADYSQQGYVDEDTGEMHWPVFFLYPEVMQSDFITDFAETQTFRQHLERMFPPQGSSPVWDAQGRYTLDNLTLEYEISVEEGLATLAEQLKRLREERGQPPHKDSREALLKMLPVKPSDLHREEKCVKMEISLDTKLVQVVSAQGYIVPGVPTFMIRPKK